MNEPWTLSKGSPVYLNKDVPFEQITNMTVVCYHDGYSGDHLERDEIVFIGRNLLLQYKSDRDGRLYVKHPFACDDEGDRSYTVDSHVSHVSLHAAQAGTFTFNAVLRDFMAYDPSSPSPFDGLEEKDTTDDYAANYGYPFQPPTVDFDGSHLLPVTIRQFFGLREEGIRWVENLIAQ